MSPRQPRKARIAQLNDRLRAHVGVPVFANPETAQLGTVMLTRGVMALARDALKDACRKVRDFDTFTRDNDPYGEHDFGAVTLESGERIFWKIDYYADTRCEMGSEDPADPARSFRVLTIMLAEEY